MNKAVKVLMSIIIVFAGMLAWGLIEVDVLMPRLVAGGLPGTLALLTTVAVCALGLRFIWNQSKGEEAMDNIQRPKRSVGKMVGGILLILFAVIGAAGNWGPNPVSNLSTITVMVLIAAAGLVLIAAGFRPKKQYRRTPL